MIVINEKHCEPKFTLPKEPKCRHASTLLEEIQEITLLPMSYSLLQCWIQLILVRKRWCISFVALFHMVGIVSKFSHVLLTSQCLPWPVAADWFVKVFVLESVLGLAWWSRMLILCYVMPAYHMNFGSNLAAWLLTSLCLWPEKAERCPKDLGFCTPAVNP